MLTLELGPDEEVRITGISLVKSTGGADPGAKGGRRLSEEEKGPFMLMEKIPQKPVLMHVSRGRHLAEMPKGSGAGVDHEQPRQLRRTSMPTQFSAAKPAEQRQLHVVRPPPPPQRKPSSKRFPFADRQKSFRLPTVIRPTPKSRYDLTDS